MRIRDLSACVSVCAHCSGEGVFSFPAKISQKFQFVLWFSGLRGAVAFVLAVTQVPLPSSPSILPPLPFPCLPTYQLLTGMLEILRKLASFCSMDNTILCYG